MVYNVLISKDDINKNKISKLINIFYKLKYGKDDYINIKKVVFNSKKYPKIYKTYEIILVNILIIDEPSILKKYFQLFFKNQEIKNVFDILNKKEMPEMDLFVECINIFEKSNGLDALLIYSLMLKIYYTFTKSFNGFSFINISNLVGIKGNENKKSYLKCLCQTYELKPNMKKRLNILKRKINEYKNDLKSLKVRYVYVYGSFLTEEFNCFSDIDLAIVIKDNSTNKNEIIKYFHDFLISCFNIGPDIIFVRNINNIKNTKFEFIYGEDL